MPNVIDSFRGAYDWLSNGHEGYPFTMDVWLEGIGHQRTYPTAEHAYQAAKALTWYEHDWVLEAARPFGTDGAKRRGRRVRSPGWDERKLDVMRDVLAAKFTHSSRAGVFLLQTDDAELIEGNDWGDTYWGVCNGVGRNWLGTLLMARRAVLRARANLEPLTQTQGATW